MASAKLSHPALRWICFSCEAQSRTLRGGFMLSQVSLLCRSHDYDFPEALCPIESYPLLGLKTSPTDTAIDPRIIQTIP
jgi:hypothetical protein